ncbi:hypothetical protein AB0H28_00015 [Micromonospora sp. NPDC050980]|uniref:hypothetical protein n=1 Tax=Micromonospora sp. NPDC050980 TaxID=3155161 RepID=UPI0033C3A9DE
MKPDVKVVRCLSTVAARIVARAVALRQVAATLPKPDEQTREVAPVADVLGELRQRIERALGRG